MAAMPMAHRMQMASYVQRARGLKTGAMPEAFNGRWQLAAVWELVDDRLDSPASPALQAQASARARVGEAPVLRAAQRQ